MTPEDFWSPFEQTISSMEEAMRLIHNVFLRWSSEGRLFAWRGQVDAGWPLYSSLYRRLYWTKGGVTPPRENDLQTAEHQSLVDLHRWGLHQSDRGRLSVLNQLAMLQHYGSPTRLIDVTFNPLIGLWFAVEEQWENGVEKNGDKDGRLFAIDVTSRLINESDERRSWEDATDRQWPGASGDTRWTEWTTQTFAWKPSHLNARIAAQNGGFLLGGVPALGSGANLKHFRKGSSSADGVWHIDDVRRAESVALHLHQVPTTRIGIGRQPDSPAYTIKIEHQAKREIRARLEELYGYKHATIYPDYPGFALYGLPHLKQRP